MGTLRPIELDSGQGPRDAAHIQTDFLAIGRLRHEFEGVSRQRFPIKLDKL